MDGVKWFKEHILKSAQYTGKQLDERCFAAINWRILWECATSLEATWTNERIMIKVTAWL